MAGAGVGEGTIRGRSRVRLQLGICRLPGRSPVLQRVASDDSREFATPIRLRTRLPSQACAHTDANDTRVVA
jgi:hypothetical protein